MPASAWKARRRARAADAQRPRPVIPQPKRYDSSDDKRLLLYVALFCLTFALSTCTLVLLSAGGAG